MCFGEFLRIQQLTKFSLFLRESGDFLLHVTQKLSTQIRVSVKFNIVTSIKRLLSQTECEISRHSETAANVGR